MIQLQPWRALKVLFGFSDTGDKRGTVKPKSLTNLAMNLYAYGKDPISTWYARKVHLTQDRLQAYKEFDYMDSDDVVTSALDLYAEDACQTDLTTGRRIWIEADDEEVENICNEMLERINANEQSFAIARESAKYGNSFSALIQEEKDDGTPSKVLQLLAAPVYALSRIEDDEGRLIGFAVCPIEQMGSAIGMAQPSDLTQGKPTDPPWAFVHWRLLGRERIESYGTSLLWPARRPYRRLRLAEDALVIYRLKRSPDRFVFEIQGLSGMSPEDRVKAMRKIRQELRKKHLIDPDTGHVRQELEPLGPDEDIIVDGEAVKVTRLTGSAQVNHVMDIDYLRKRFFGSLKIPPDYMGFSDAKSGFIAESPLSYQDVNFARVVKRLQHCVMEGFGLVAQINLCWCGIDPRSSRAKFTVHMNPVSALDEKNRLELERVRAETLEILQRVGQALGIDSDEWHAYLLQRSQIPTHLLRPSRGKEGDLLKGKVVVQEKIKKIVESKKNLVESTEKKIRESVDEELCEDFFGRISGNIEIRHFTERKDGDKVVTVETKKYVDIRNLFAPCFGPNTFQSNGTMNLYDHEHLPLATLGNDKKLMEAKAVTEWKSDSNKRKIKNAKGLMSESLKKLKEDIEKKEEAAKKRQALEEKYMLDSEDLEEFDFEEDEDEESTDGTTA